MWSLIFTEKTFADNPKTTKFTKVFSLVCFPLYGISISSTLIINYTDSNYANHIPNTKSARFK